MNHLNLAVVKLHPISCLAIILLNRPQLSLAIPTEADYIQAFLLFIVKATYTRPFPIFSQIWKSFPFVGQRAIFLNSAQCMNSLPSCSDEEVISATESNAATAEFHWTTVLEASICVFSHEIPDIFKILSAYLTTEKIQILIQLVGRLVADWFKFFSGLNEIHCINIEFT